jgi:hypothetical protein
VARVLPVQLVLLLLVQVLPSQRLTLARLLDWVELVLQLLRQLLKRVGFSGQ